MKKVLIARRRLITIFIGGSNLINRLERQRVGDVHGQKDFIFASKD